MNIKITMKDGTEVSYTKAKGLRFDKISLGFYVTCADNTFDIHELNEVAQLEVT